MFSAVSRIAVTVTAIYMSSLSSETVTRDQIKNDEVPIRVTITPKKNDVEICFTYLHDHPKRPYSNVVRAHMLLDLDHPALGRIRTGMESLDDTDLDEKKLTTGYIQITPDIAKNCRIEIFVGPTALHSLVEHRYVIPLDIFADELKTK